MNCKCDIGLITSLAGIFFQILLPKPKKWVHSCTAVGLLVISKLSQARIGIIVLWVAVQQTVGTVGLHRRNKISVGAWYLMYGGSGL